MGNKWTEKERQYLVDNYSNQPTKKIAEYLKRPISSVYGQADKMKLKKCPKYLKKHVYTITPNEATQFKKGHKVWNKGKKLGTSFGGVATQFKKGSKPHNWVPEYSTRINVDGYKEIKIGKKWPLYHRWLYAKNVGPIKPNEVIRFKDGNKENFSLDNLEKISREEHQLRNSVHNLPDDLKQVINLKRTISKLITEHAKKQN